MSGVRRSPAEIVRELCLPPSERRAARMERSVERELRRQRDNDYSATRRAAALEAESRRNSNLWGRG